MGRRKSSTVSRYLRAESDNSKTGTPWKPRGHRSSLDRTPHNRRTPGVVVAGWKARTATVTGWNRTAKAKDRPVISFARSNSASSVGSDRSGGESSSHKSPRNAVQAFLSRAGNATTTAGKGARAAMSVTGRGRRGLVRRESVNLTETITRGELTLEQAQMIQRFLHTKSKPAWRAATWTGYALGFVGLCCCMLQVVIANGLAKQPCADGTVRSDGTSPCDKAWPVAVPRNT